VISDETPTFPTSSKEPKRGTHTAPWNLEATCGARAGERVSIVRIGVPTGAAESTSGCKTEEAEEAEIKSEITGKQGCYASNPAPAGCIGVVVFIPSLGMEVDYGGTLRVAVQNGVGNGLDQSRWVLSGAKTGELQCQAPVGCATLATMTGELKVQGYEAAQLVQER
jgi:hypothetical protein